MLADEVARALRRHHLKGEVVSVQIRRPDMVDMTRQMKVGHHTYLQLEIQELAMELVRENWTIGAPIRAITVGVSKLVPADQVVEQVSLFDFTVSDSANEKRRNGRPLGSVDREKQEKLEGLMDQLRKKHGEGSITLGYQENKEIGLTHSTAALKEIVDR